MKPEMRLPEVGQAVRVRNRLATVRAVDPYESRNEGRLHLVEVEYLDDCQFPAADQLLWEAEATGRVLGATALGLKSIAAGARLETFDLQVVFLANGQQRLAWSLQFVTGDPDGYEAGQNVLIDAMTGSVIGLKDL